MSGRVYGLTHTAAANTHTRTHTEEEEMDAQECTESSETNTRLLFLSKRRQNANNARLQSHKANKHSCYKQNYGQTQTHMRSQGLLSHKLCMANLLGGGEGMCCVLCVCSPLDRVSLMTQSPAFSAQNSVSSAFTKERAIRSKPPGPTQRLQCSARRDNASIFKCFLYMPAHFLNLGCRFSQNQAFFLDFYDSFYQRCLK